MPTNFGEYPFRNCLENRHRSPIGTPKVAMRSQRDPDRRLPGADEALEGPQAIFQTVSPRTSVNKGKEKGRSVAAPTLDAVLMRGRGETPSTTLLAHDERVGGHVSEPLVLS